MQMKNVSASPVKTKYVTIWAGTGLLVNVLVVEYYLSICHLIQIVSNVVLKLIQFGFINSMFNFNFTLQTNIPF